MDPLSEIVSLLHPHDCVAAGFDAAGDWSIRFDSHTGMKCNAVIRGHCWLAVDGTEAVCLEAGDCAILPRGRTFLLSARPARSGHDAQTLYAPVRHGGTALYNGGGEFFMTGARFLLSGPAADVLTGALPPLIVLRGGGAQGDGIRWALDRLAGELREPRLGGALSIEHLSHFLLLQVMREHLSDAPPETAGWLAALSDPPVSRAVVALHADPARAWTLQDLASEAHLSRTAFALRFRRVAGQTPMEYLTQWRMLSAAEKLRAGRLPVARIATEAGYASESAFAAAFKRVMGRSPRRHARDANAAGPRDGASNGAPDGVAPGSPPADA